MIDTYMSEAEELVKACKRVSELGYVTSQGGNLSYRVDDDVILITPTKVPKGNIGIEDVVLINNNNDVLYANEGRRPTGEAPFHTHVLNIRTDFKALVHAHPPEITALAIAHSDLLSRPLLPEPIIEVGPVLPVPYKEPLSDALANAFTPVLTKSNAYLMLNHGILLGSVDGIGRAVELLEMVEATAKSARIAAAMGSVVEIPKEEVKNLENTIKTRGLSMPGAPGVNNSLIDLYFTS